MKKILTSILEIPWVWRLFRKTLDAFFGLYRKRQEVIRSFGVTDQSTIIDIACGTGQYSKLTKNRYLGVDLDTKYIEAARKLYSNDTKKFLAADANTADIADASFDAAVLIDATHHLSDEENKKLFKTLGRVASEAVIICDPVRQTKKWNLIGRALIAMDRGNYIRPKEHLLSLIGESLTIEKVANLRMMSVDGVCILARPK